MHSCARESDHGRIIRIEKEAQHSVRLRARIVSVCE